MTTVRKYIQKHYRYGVLIKHLKQSRNNCNETWTLFKLIKRYILTLKSKFKGITIPNVPQGQTYGAIFFKKENQRHPLLSFIKRKICKHIKNDSNEY